MSHPQKKPEYRLLGIFGQVPIDVLPKTTGNELKAYIALASFQGNGDVCWPGLDQIAKRASLSLQATSEAITGLVKKGLATRKRNYGKTNTYRVLVPTKEAEDSYQENPDNQENSDNKEKSDVDHREKSDDGYQENPDDIRKQHIKRTNEKNREREEPLPQKVKTPEDPFDPVPFHLQPKITNDGWNYNEEGANLVINFFEDYYQREFKMSSGRIKERKMEASKLYNYLSQEDKIAELKEIILQFEYSWHGHKCILPKKADSPFKATPAKIIELWEKLSPTNVPPWIREGHSTEREWKNARSQQQEAEKEKARQQRTTSQSVEIYDPNTDPAMIAALEDFGSLLVKGVRND